MEWNKTSENSAVVIAKGLLDVSGPEGERRMIAIAGLQFDEPLPVRDGDPLHTGMAIWQIKGRDPGTLQLFSPRWKEGRVPFIGYSTASRPLGKKSSSPFTMLLRDALVAYVRGLDHKRKPERGEYWVRFKDHNKDSLSQGQAKLVLAARVGPSQADWPVGLVQVPPPWSGRYSGRWWAVVKLGAGWAPAAPLKEGVMAPQSPPESGCRVVTEESPLWWLFSPSGQPLAYYRDPPGADGSGGEQAAMIRAVQASFPWTVSDKTKELEMVELSLFGS